jgi:hypothetical protein
LITDRGAFRRSLLAKFLFIISPLTNANIVALYNHADTNDG